MLAAVVLFVAVIQLSAKDLSLKSPDGTLSAVLNTTDRVSLEIFRDGINADTKAIDYVHDFKAVDADTVIDASLVSGGGWLARIVEL